MTSTPRFNKPPVTKNCEVSIGLDIFWHSRRPEPAIWEALQRDSLLEAFGDPDDVLVDAITNLPREEFPVPRSVDPYGDTVLDSGQCATAHVEVQGIPAWRNNSLVVLLETLLSKCCGAPGTYVYVADD
ncbi:hypothetical protein [Kitasatospora sp. NPDC093558]|uniref:hypothetical protein n=1 Tax=Kitasatospora sp. NPDC093558 TaxID=3155201 RepID=UPI00343EC92B